MGGGVSVSLVGLVVVVVVVGDCALHPMWWNLFFFFFFLPRLHAFDTSELDAEEYLTRCRFFFCFVLGGGCICVFIPGGGVLEGGGPSSLRGAGLLYPPPHVVPWSFLFLLHAFET